jgi:hypothetical protein
LFVFEFFIGIIVDNFVAIAIAIAIDVVIAVAIV